MPCVDKDKPTAATFRIIYPVFALVSDEIINYWLENAKSVLCYKQLCEEWERAVFLYIAHNVVVSGAYETAMNAAAEEENEEILKNAFNMKRLVKRHTVDNVTTEFDPVTFKPINNNIGKPTKPTGGRFNGSMFAPDLNALLKRYAPRGFITGMGSSGGCGGGFPDRRHYG